MVIYLGYAAGIAFSRPFALTLPLYALLEALRNVFGTSEFSAKDVLAKTEVNPASTSLETGLREVGGDNALKSALSLGRVLRDREGRIVQGLSLSGRHDKGRGTWMYRILTN